MIGTIASKKACGGSDNGANTGKLGCLSLFGTPTHLLGLVKGTTLLATDNFDDAFLRGLVQTGKAVPLIDASSFEDVSSEDTYTTNSKGIKRLNLKGLPEYKLTFEEGHEFYREVAKMESYKAYDYMIGDESGNWLLARKSDGNFQGMTGGHTTPELTKRKVEGGDSEMKSIVVQFLDRLQWDTNYEILHAEDLTLTPQEMPVVNGTEIQYSAAPASLDTVVLVKVVLASDRDTLVEGLLVTDFVATVNGATNAITLVTEDTPGNYSLTMSALATGESLRVDHFHGATNSVIADSNAVLYRNTNLVPAVVV